MKKILLFAVSAFALNLSAQTIPNNDFENWTVHDDLQSTGIVMDSLESGVWESGNPMLITLPALAAGLPKGFMYDTTYAYSGSHAVAMRTGFLNGLMATGNLFTGVIDESINGINQVVIQENPLAAASTGYADTYSPSIMNGYFFYEPGVDYIYYNPASQMLDTIVGGGDTCRISVMAHKWNNSTMQRDTIGYGEFATTATSTGWAPFSIPLNYSTATSPDSLSILFLSSYGGTRFAGAYGSLLVVDSISFEGDYLNTSKFKSDLIKIYSYENTVSIENVAGSYEFSVCDMMGKEVYKSDKISGNKKIEIYKSGIYIVNVLEKGILLKSNKIIINN